MARNSHLGKSSAGPCAPAISSCKRAIDRRLPTHVQILSINGLTEGVWSLTIVNGI